MPAEDSFIYQLIGSTRIWVFVDNFIFPVRNNGPLRSLNALRNQGNIAVNALREETVLTSILESNESSDLFNSTCIDRVSDNGASVYLYSSSVDALNSFTSTKTQESNLPDTKTERPATISVFREAIDELLNENAYSHWAIDIPERGVACDLLRKPNHIEVEVRTKDSLDELNTTVGGRKLDKMRKQLIGQTFLSSDTIRKLYNLRDDMSRNIEDLQDYDVVRNNCQGLWQQGMLRLIVCTCDSNSIRLDELVSIQDKVLDKSWSHSQCALAMSLLIALAKRKYIPWLGPFFWLPWAHRILFLAEEITEWIEPYLFLYIPAKLYFEFRKASIDHSQHNERDSKTVLDLSYRSRINRPTSRAMSWFRPTMFALYALHIPLGWYWRSSSSWSYLEWLDIGIGAVAQLCILASRTIASRHRGHRRGYCWAGIFAQLEQKCVSGTMSKESLTAKVLDFLSTA